MTFEQFILNNVKRNSQTYLAYFFSSIFSVMIFFSFAAFSFHPNISDQTIQKSVKSAMIASEYIIFIFAFLFVLYSVSTFLKVRNKEFGTLMILGMSKRQLNKLVFIENMIIGSLSIVIGTALGIVFFKFFLMLSSKIIGIDSMKFYFPLKAIALTFVSFLILFIGISSFTIFLVRTNKIIELLKGSKKPKKEPKASIILSIVSAILILGGYTLSLTARPATLVNLVIPVIVIVVIGTFLFFSQLSIFIIKLLKSNRKFYLNRTNMLWISDLAYRIKDNARMLFLVSILSSVAFTSISTFYIVDSNMKSELSEDVPFAINYRVREDIKEDYEDINTIENKLDKNNVNYKKAEVIIKMGYIEEEKYEQSFIKLSQYNKIADILKFNKIELKKNEAFIATRFDEEENLANKMIKLKNSDIKLNVVGAKKQIILPQGIFQPFIVVEDSIFEQMENSGKINDVFYGYYIEKWDKYVDLSVELKNKIDKEQPDFWMLPYEYKLSKQMSSLLLYIGFFIGCIFFMAAGSFLYFRLYADLSEEKQKYYNISKIGLTDKEMKKIATIQMGCLFFIPYIIAVVHTLVALKPLQLLYSDIFIHGIKVLIVFAVVQIIYFLIIRNKYINYLLKNIV
ncbi:ABC transporter permease [Tepidibacter hydrothermalis]|uniref:ABC transporter permease n=1 Tax=Tepidibacter hydrothermalis TaxID=3036126 RepID=A0ABY8EH35_9FIRM|nr:ABC transporter permease [Tepidibacter hydrothermalis]WFD11084.1 ABC transporter permease [Tepidibacter hydrothermalis]